MDDVDTTLNNAMRWTFGVIIGILAFIVVSWIIVKLYNLIF
jgi:hypothetical protein